MKTYQQLEHNIMKHWEKNPIPLVTIICMTYNHEKFIREAIDGFLKQKTTFPFEIIIHDDASSDNTAAIIKEYTDQYPQIIKPIFQQENQYSKGKKPSVHIYEQVQSKYIAVCEGDDYWTDPNKLQKQISFLEDNAVFVITFHDCQPFDENGNLTAKYGGAKRDLESIELQKSTPIYTLTTCFRNVIDEFPPEYQLTKFNDLFIWSLLGAHGKGKYMSDIKPAMYRVHDGGIFSKKTKSHKIEMQLITRCLLFIYHKRQGNKRVADHFLRKMLISILRSIKVRGLINALKDAVISKIIDK